MDIQGGISQTGACTRTSVSLDIVPYVLDFIMRDSQRILEICENYITDFCGYLKVELTNNAICHYLVVTNENLRITYLTRLMEEEYH